MMLDSEIIIDHFTQTLESMDMDYLRKCIRGLSSKRRREIIRACRFSKEEAHLKQSLASRKARANMTPERRSDISHRAGVKRWANMTPEKLEAFKKALREARRGFLDRMTPEAHAKWCENASKAQKARMARMTLEEKRAQAARMHAGRWARP